MGKLWKLQAEVKRFIVWCHGLSNGVSGNGPVSAEYVEAFDHVTLKVHPCKLCVAMCGYVYVLGAICCYVCPCVAMLGYGWPCVAMCTYVWVCVARCTYVWLYVAMCSYMWRAPHPTGPVHPDIVSTSAENSVLEYKTLNIFWGRINCLPIGHNDTKHFLCPIRSRHLLNFWK